MATATWNSYALSGRFMTKRRRTRIRKEAFDKQLLKKFEELKEVERAQRNLPLAELNPPVQKGWKRFFVLRPDLANNKDAAFFLELLEKINTVTYSHRKDFKHKRRRRGKKVDVERIQELREFYGYESVFRKMSEKELTFFRMETEFIGHSTRTRVKYVFTEPWRFILRVRPNMITHVRTVDITLMSNERKLDNYFERNYLYPRLWKILEGKNQYYRRSAPKYSVRPELKKELRKEIESLNKKEHE